MKLFIILPRFPFPLEKGDKLRAYHLIKHLSENNEIILCSLNDNKNLQQSSIDALKPFCKPIHVFNLSNYSIFMNLVKVFFSKKPFQVGYFYNKRIHRKIRKLIRENKPDHIFCQLLRVAEYARFEDTPKTLDYQDVFSKGIQRRIKNSPLYFKPILKQEYKRLLKYENEIFDQFDNKLIISKPDRDFIPHPDKEKIVIITNGVDYDYFSPQTHEKEIDLIFTGNMGYPPNINGAEYLVNKILPIVRKQKPELKVVIAGANPHKKILSLQSRGIEVTGWVRDMREYYAKARIFIAPMQIGTGLQNKLLEAMAMKIPCITSPLANKALEAKNGIEILIGNDAEEYAKHIINLLDNKEMHDKIAQKGYDFVRNKYSWENSCKILENSIVNSLG